MFGFAVSSCVTGAGKCDLRWTLVHISFLCWHKVKTGCAVFPHMGIRWAECWERGVRGKIRMTKREGVSLLSPSHAVILLCPLKTTLTTGKSFKVYDPLCPVFQNCLLFSRSPVHCLQAFIFFFFF